MNITQDRTIGSIVAEDYRAAAALTRYGIDFCCKGGRTVEEVCRTKNINFDQLTNEILADLARDPHAADDTTQWTLARLVDHVEQVHHAYVNDRTPILLQYLNKLCKVHGERHPELFEIEEEFRACSHTMAVHMKKEELMLFPFIKQLERASIERTAVPQPHFGTVSRPVTVMMHDHDAEGDRFRRIKELSYDYANPPDGCVTYATTMKLLQEFEADLHRHIHLENNILFPGAMELEHHINMIASA